MVPLIPEKEQKHLFERFFRANNVINIQGTGLGLNIHDKIAVPKRNSKTNTIITKIRKVSF